MATHIPSVSKPPAHEMCTSVSYPSINLDVSCCDQIPRDSEQNSPVKPWLIHPHTDKGGLVSSTHLPSPIAHLHVRFVPLASVRNLISDGHYNKTTPGFNSVEDFARSRWVVNECGHRPLGLQVPITSTEASSKR